MTQEVQPLAWQKRTNLEEHQQFFSKINEIIANLAPTVGEAEQAIATANSASAAASAAASQAQTAASTVEGYDNRLTTAEGDIDALQGRMGTTEEKIAAIEGRESDYLKKTGAAQTVTSQIMVPTTATGGRDAQIANGTRIQNDLAAYAPMVRTTGNQDIGGVKTFIETITIKSSNVDRNNPPESTAYMQQIAFIDTNGIEMIRFIPTYESNGVPHLYLVRYKQDGTSITTELGV